MNVAVYSPGAIVRARGRDWVVLPDVSAELIPARPLAGREDEDTILVPALEDVRQSEFELPSPQHAGSSHSLRMLRDAMTLKLRAGAGPFRSFGNIGIEPRIYQLVPLMMALRQPQVRLLISDDVGVGKTIEALLIAREMWDRGEIRGMTVLCPAHLCEQWKGEMIDRFNLSATVVHPRNIRALEKTVSQTGKSVFEEYPVTIVSLDYIKSQTRRDDFLRACPDLVIVDEAHGCTLRSGSVNRQQRYELLKELVNDERTERHLVMLSATPHSGDVEAFHNLLGLLDPLYLGLSDDDSARTRELRLRLGQQFVQRRRKDIEQWIENDTQFPQRLYADAPFAYSARMSGVMKMAVNAASEAVKQGESIHYWSALGLLRAISSSPAAGLAALQTRVSSEEAQIEKDAIARQVLDGSDDDMGTEDATAAATRIWDPDGRLKRELEGVAGKGNDAKLDHLIQIVKDLLSEGLRPVVFCRFIATADYLEAELSKALRNTEVRSVSGRYNPDERINIVHELSADASKQYVMVATDCLSEGVNLQGAFSAVVHYDLSWNPTQHEQREGRVDRFGQPRPEVKAVMLYSGDSPIDVAVLRNITAKARRIKRDLGIAVPLPDDEQTVAKAVMSDVLAAAEGQIQISLDFGIDKIEEADTSLQWQSALDREKKSRTLFSQMVMKPEDVIPEWEKTVSALGANELVERFMKRCWQGLGVEHKSHGHGRYSVDWSTIPADHSGLRDALSDARQPEKAEVSFQGEPPPGALGLTRSHPMVVCAAEYMAERALAEDDPGAVARCAVVRVPVDRKRTLLLLRLRHELALRDYTAGADRNLLAEELVSVEITPDGLAPVDPETLAELFKHEAVGNLNPAAIERTLRPILDEIKRRRPDLDALAEARAEELLDDHSRVRKATGDRFRSKTGTEKTYRVKALLPVDVIGVYHLLPGGAA